MMKAIRVAALAFLSWTQLAWAATPTSEQKEVTAFVQKVYSYSANMFEFGYFNGNFEPDKQCALMEKFFVRRLITRPEKSQGCDAAARYPGAGSEDLGDNRYPGQMPKPKLSTPIVEGDKATISAKTKEFGSVLYFLTKTEKGWRIENALTNVSSVRPGVFCDPATTQLPTIQFIREPTADQLKKLPRCD